MGRNARIKRERDARHVPTSRRWRAGYWWIVGGVLLLVAMAGAGTWIWNGARAAPGAAPRFNLVASTGRQITLDEFLGKQEVVLLFYMVET